MAPLQISPLGAGELAEAALLLGNTCPGTVKTLGECVFRSGFLMVQWEEAPSQKMQSNLLVHGFYHP